MEDVDYTDLYTRLVTAMDAGAPRGWEHLELTVRVLGTTMQDQLYAVYAEGRRVRCDMQGTASYDPVIELREALYQRGKGAWWTMVATSTAEGGFHADLDYDHEPARDIDVTDEMYADDVARFPRDEEATPPWLAQRLRRAAQQQQDPHRRPVAGRSGVSPRGGRRRPRRAGHRWSLRGQPHMAVLALSPAA